jgi:predicted site-specific integrase-resolvase
LTSYKYDTSLYRMANLSTLEVARKVGISRVTLERWLAGGKVPSPKTIRFGKNEFRDWTDQDVERVRKFKAAHYRKGRGRKKGKKSKV